MSKNKIENIVINALAALGVLLWFVLQCCQTLLPAQIYTPQHKYLEALALSTTLLIQILRGLLFQLNVNAIPQWLSIQKMDKRFMADTTLIFLTLWGILELTAPANIDLKSNSVMFLSEGLFCAQAIFGLGLFVINTKRTSANLGIALVATIAFMVIFMAPWLLAGGIAYLIYHFLQLHEIRQIEILAVSALLPLLISVIRLSLNDKRDRSKNTTEVIQTQLMTLPIVPLAFFSLDAVWPKTVSAMWIAPILLLFSTVPIMLNRKKKPWLVKEKVQILENALALKNEQLEPPLVSLNFETEIALICKELAESNFNLKNSLDYIDRADTYWKLGDLQLELALYLDARKSYEEAIKAYDQALLLSNSDPATNRIALSNKFKTVERLNELEHRQNN